MVCKLDKAVYGLHQSGREWFLEIHDVLLKLGFNKLEWCNCVYTCNDGMVLKLYVEDIDFIGKSMLVVQKGITLLEKHFNLRY